MSRGKKSRSSSRRSAARRRVFVAEPLKPGQQALAAGLTLHSYQIGAMPLVNQILERMRLEEFFREYLPADDPRCRFLTAQALLVLVQNVLLSREPVYAVGAWAARFAGGFPKVLVQDVNRFLRVPDNPSKRFPGGGEIHTPNS